MLIPWLVARRAGRSRRGFWWLKTCLLLCADRVRAAGHRRHERQRSRARHAQPLDRGDVRRQRADAGGRDPRRSCSRSTPGAATPAVAARLRDRRLDRRADRLRLPVGVGHDRASGRGASDAGTRYFAVAKPTIRPTIEPGRTISQKYGSPMRDEVGEERADRQADRHDDRRSTASRWATRPMISPATTPLNVEPDHDADDLRRRSPGRRRRSAVSPSNTPRTPPSSIANTGLLHSVLLTDSLQRRPRRLCWHRLWTQIHRRPHRQTAARTASRCTPAPAESAARSGDRARTSRSTSDSRYASTGSWLRNRARSAARASTV